MTLHYLPAAAAATDGWLALTAESRLLLVQVDEGAPLIDRMWAGISSLSGFQEALDELTRDGLSATPPFALLEWSEPTADEYAVRVIVRGAVTVTVTTASGAAEAGARHALTGADISTWIERSYPRVTGFAVVTGSAVANRATSAVGTGGAPELPLGAGAAWTSAVMSRSGSTSAAPTTLPVKEQTSAPSEAERQDAHAAPEQSAGDHDGMTVMADVNALRARVRSAPAGRPSVSVGSAAVGGSAFFLDLSTGGRHDLDSPVIVGRSPSAGRVAGTVIPRLVTIPGDRDISRNHVRFAVEGDAVVVTDLHSRNGTHVVFPGRSPQRLPAGEPMAVIADTVVDLGGGVTITVRAES